jgi:hypothetical protein
LASDAPLTALHPPLDNVLQTIDHFEFLALELHFHGWKAQKLHGARSGCTADVLMGSHQIYFFHTDTEFNSDLAPCDFWDLPTMKRKLRGKKFRSDQRSVARFQEMGGAL